MECKSKTLKGVLSEDPAQLLQCSQVYSSRRRRRRRMSSSSSGARQAAPCPGERSQSCWGAGEVRTPDPRVCSVRGAAEQDTGRGMHARRQGSLPCAEETIAKRTDETQMKSDRVPICRVSLTTPQKLLRILACISTYAYYLTAHTNNWWYKYG